MQEHPGEWKKNALYSYCPESAACIATASASKTWRESEEQHVCLGARGKEQRESMAPDSVVVWA